MNERRGVMTQTDPGTTDLPHFFPPPPTTDRRLMRWPIPDSFWFRSPDLIPTTDSLFLTPMRVRLSLGAAPDLCDLWVPHWLPLILRSPMHPLPHASAPGLGPWQLCAEWQGCGWCGVARTLTHIACRAPVCSFRASLLAWRPAPAAGWCSRERLLACLLACLLAAPTGVGGTGACAEGRLAAGAAAGFECLHLFLYFSGVGGLKGCETGGAC